MIALNEQFTNLSKRISSDQLKKEHDMLEKTRLRYRQEIVDAVAFANVKSKVIYNKRYKSLLLQKDDKMFLRLHKNYKLSGKTNSKLSHQRCDSFKIKKKIERMTYELELSAT